MKTQFVDTNIFLRYLIKSDPDKTQACYELFKRAERNEVTLTTSEAVIAEVVFVLSSKRHYQLGREEIKQKLYPIISLRGLKLPQRRDFLKALDYYAKSSLDFEDCLTIAHMERQRLSELYSYDQDFDQIQKIERIEP